MEISTIVLNGNELQIKDATARAAIGDINAVLDQVNGEVV